MAQSSDAVIKNEICEKLGTSHNEIQLRIFPESSNQDQLPFSHGGLTFGYKNVYYGSCDACWYVDGQWNDGFNNSVVTPKPIIALEGSDCLNRGSTGNAQYQRFHHALGAVRNGLIGIYYLRKGRDPIRPDLFGMGYFASQVEKGEYLIIDDLSVIKDILDVFNSPQKCNSYIQKYLNHMYSIFKDNFDVQYHGSWTKFAQKRSTIIKNEYVVKYAGRMLRSFTDGSQRGGHIAVGEMYLTKYFFSDKTFFYLLPRMTQLDLDYLDKHKQNDKEWRILRHEPGVTIKIMDDIEGLSVEIRDMLMSIKDTPLNGGQPNAIYKHCVKSIVDGLMNDQLQIRR